jgi:RNA-binding protein
LSPDCHKLHDCKRQLPVVYIRIKTSGDKPVKLSSQQRKHLESLAHHLEPIVRIGKQGLESKIILSVVEAFNTHELIKIKLLDSSPVEAAEAAKEICMAADAVLVRVIGRVIVLYKPFSDKPRKIELP